MSINFTGDFLQTTGAFQELAVGTACFWAYPTLLSGVNRIFGSDTAWEARFSGTSLLMEILTGGTITSTVTFSTNTWYHIALVWNGTTKGIYVDGVAAPAPATSTHAAAGNDTQLAIASSTWQSTEEFDGLLADFRLYNRALPQPEVELIFNGQGKDGIINGLVHWWQLNAGAEGTLPTIETDIVGRVSVANTGPALIYQKPTQQVSHLRRTS